VPLSVEFVDYLYSICAGLTDRDLLETFVEQAMKIEDYVRDIGGVFERWVSQEVGISFSSPDPAELAESAVRKVDGQGTHQGV